MSQGLVLQYFSLLSKVVSWDLGPSTCIKWQAVIILLPFWYNGMFIHHRPFCNLFTLQGPPWDHWNRIE